MLTDIENLVLSFLTKNYPQNKYTIVEIADIKEDIYKCNTQIKKIDVKQALLSLNSSKYIDVKYYDDNVFCLSVLTTADELNTPKINCASEKSRTNYSLFYILIICILVSNLLSSCILYFLLK